MKRGVVLFTVLLILSATIVHAEALSPQKAREIADQAEKIADLIKKLKSTKADKYNRVKGTITDQNGNPVKCDSIDIYYNDYWIEVVEPSGGKFDAIFNHGSTFPTGIISVKTTGCPCIPSKASISGPEYPDLNKILEKLTKFLEEEARERGTGALEEGFEKIMEKALGPAGGSFAKYYLAGAKSALEGIGKIRDKFQEVNEQIHKEFGLEEPSYPGGRMIHEWFWYSWFHSPTTEFTIDLKVKCGDEYGGRGWRPPAVPIDELTEEEETPPRIPETGRQPETPPRPPETPPRPPVTLPPTGPTIGTTKSPCKHCDHYLEEILRWEKILRENQAELAAHQQSLKALEQEISSAGKKLENAKQKLIEFDNPKNWASSGDRTVTQTDVEVKRAALRMATQKFSSGEWTAQQLADYWDNLDPETLAELKREARNQLVKDIQDAQKNLDDLLGQKAKLLDLIAELQDRIKDALAEIERLNKAYQNCLKTCKDNIPETNCESYGLFTKNNCDNACKPFEKCSPVAQPTSAGMLTCHRCVPGTPPITGARCGDKKLDKGEQCDPPQSACKTTSGIGICNDACQCAPVPTIGTPETPQEIRVVDFDAKTNCGGDVIMKGRIIGIPDKISSMKFFAGDKAHSMGYSASNGWFQASAALPPGEYAFRIVARLTTGESVDVAKGKFVIPPCGTETGTQTTTSLPPTSTPPKSCEQLCSERGLVSSPPNHQEYILSFLNKYECVSGVTIRMPGKTVLSNECTCYSTQKPGIDVDTRKPVCSTICGPVECGKATECPCPDKPNCIATATCTWQGWKWGTSGPVPSVGTG